MSTVDPELHALRQAATADDPAAWSRLALALVLRHAMDEAFDWHGRAAARGHVVSQVELGRMHLHGIAGDVDTAAAVACFEAAEARGFAPAAYYLALVALGDAALRRDARIDTRLQAAVDAGFAPALRAAAVHYGRRPDPRDQALCVRLMDAAAQRGDAVAAQLLVARLRNGEGTPADAAAATRLEQRLAQAGIAPLPDIVAMPLGETAVSMPPGRLALEDALLPPRRTTLSERPRVRQVDGLLSSDECRLLVACARPMLRPSQTVDPDTGQPLRLALRTSDDAAFDPIVEDVALRCVQLRMAQAADVPLVHAEHLTVLRYAPGQEYRPHRDYVPPGAVERDRPDAGNRARTICAYLNTVEAGGATEFPVPGLRIAPAPGRAVVFDNLQADGTPDVDSLHAGTPVERGEKWLATLWLRERPYRAY